MTSTFGGQAEIEQKVKAVLHDGSFEPFRSPDCDQMLSAIHESSMDLVLFYVTLERSFGIQFSLEEIASNAFASLGSLTEIIQKKTAAS